MSQYIELAELRINEKFKKELMEEKGYICYEHDYYDIDITTFAKLKLKYDSIDLLSNIMNYRISVTDIPRHDRVMVKIAKKYKFNIVKVKRGTRYKIEQNKNWTEYREKIVTENDIEWLIA